MKRLKNEVVQFFHAQNFVIVSTVGEDGIPHNACKGVVDIDRRGQVYLLDLYRAETFANLQRNINISVTAVDEHRFKGYCLKGRAKIIKGSELKPDILKLWEDRIAGRITQRVLKNIRGEKGSLHHPEVQLPSPAYMISMEVEEIVDLTPHKLK